VKELDYELIKIVKDLAGIIYRELPRDLGETRKKEIAQKIAIELTNKICKPAPDLNRLYTEIEYSLWLEYDVLLSNGSRRKLFELLNSNEVARRRF